MAISRMQQPRQMYGLGSFVKKAVRKVTRPFTKVAKKLVPKEIAGIMRVAAPFLPPGYREAAYLLGTAKQTGRISPVDLALTLAPTVGRMTTPGGQTVAQRIGGIKVPFTGEDGMTLKDVFVGTPGTEGSYSDIARSPVQQGAEQMGSIFTPGKEATSGLFGKGGEFFRFGKEGGPGIFDTKVGQTLFGKEKPGGTFGPSFTKLAGFGTAAITAITSAKTPEEAGNALVAQTGDPASYEEGVKMFSTLKPGTFDIREEFRLPAADGGIMRTDYAMGAGEKGVVNPFQPKPQGPVLPEEDKPFKPKPLKPIKMAEFDLKDYMEEFERVFPEMIEKRGTQEYMDMLEDYFRGLASKDKEGIMMAKEGGRANLALGTRPTAEETGLGGLPIEADMRYTGGFMPYGAKEKADDVPARLSKNEFVFTADAVRAAGGGSVNKGAKKMYQTMKQLEAKPEAKGMMA